MDESVIRIHPPQGEIVIVREKLHGTAINCLITPYPEPEAWFFKQFPTRGAIEEYALEHHLTLKVDKDDSNNNE